MKKITLSIFITALLCSIVACAQDKRQEAYVPPKPDYAVLDLWYPTKEPTKDADIFYLYPTLGTKPVDPQGNRSYYTDVYNASEREMAAKNQRYISDIYADTSFNLYSPYYRQMTIEYFTQGETAYKNGLEIPLSDLIEAFDHYIKHLNKGRPFILMGHSQGSLLLIEMLKRHISETLIEKQMIAAVLIGFQITAEDLVSYQNKLRPANGESDLGVVVNFNSLTALGSNSPIINRPAVCINPINWKTDGTMARREEHKGIYRYDKQSGRYKITPHFTGGYTKNGYMICTDIDPKIHYDESLRELFPLGCLHMIETWLYSANIKENLTVRRDKFFERAKQ